MNKLAIAMIAATVLNLASAGFSAYYINKRNQQIETLTEQIEQAKQVRKNYNDMFELLKKVCGE